MTWICIAMISGLVVMLLLGSSEHEKRLKALEAELRRGRASEAPKREPRGH